MAQKIPGVPLPKPWLPAQLFKADAGALKALQRGDATPEQQQRAIRVICETLCGIHDLQYYPDSQRDSDFAQGKRYVALQIVKMLNCSMDVFADNPVDERGST